MADAGLKIGSFALKGAAIAGAAIAGLATKGVKSADDLAKAVNGLEASTGTADDSTTKFKESMIDLYNQNFGDSFEDIGVAMSEISRQTGFTGEALKETTKNALILRDTFDMEVNESTRAAQAMMQQFGYTSEEAFNLIAQGAQNGLDKNGDMLDSINEYSVHFEQLGLDGTDMFNALLAGSEGGAFSIDKVGDAFKEFGIRVKDGSKASAEAFESMGLDSKKMTDSFAVGGEEANAAYYKVLESLEAMKDPVEQNAAGVALFGTMWEDLGADATLAAMGLSDSFNETTATMEKLNEVKYDTVGEAISGIGRKFETGVLVPIGEKILPILEQFATKIDENMPQIQATVDTAMSIAGGLFDALAESIQWVTDNLDIVVPVVAGFAAAMGALVIIGVIKKMIDLWNASVVIQTFLQHGLNAALMANPIGAVILLIGLLVAAGVVLYKNWDLVKEKATALWTGIKTTFDKIKTSITDSINSAKDAVEKAINKIKGFFDFKFKWPELKMPKFSIQGSMNPLKWLEQGVPRLKVNWNADGAIFDKPTIFNTPYGMQGVGEAGPEAVAPISKLQEYIRDAVGDAKGGNNDAVLKEILRALKEMKIVMDTGELVGVVESELGHRTQRNLGGVGFV